MLTAVLAALFLTAQPQVTAPASRPAAPAAAPAPADGPYRIIKTFDVGGEGGWDIVTVDSGDNRLYVPRGSHVMVIDTNTGKVLGDVLGTDGVHGACIAMGHGFTSNGKSGDVSVFDLANFKVLQTVKAGTGPDEIVFDPTTKRVLCFNGKSNDVTVIDAAPLSPLGTVALGGKPEFAVCDNGKVFVNLEDKSEIVQFDAATMKVESRRPIAPAKEPSGLALDTIHHRLFAVGGNEMMAIVDSTSGKVVATPKIGKRPDGAEFDPGQRFAFSSNGEGTLTVIGPTKTPSGAAGTEYEVVQTLTTQRGARTMALDRKTVLIYLPCAEYEEAKAGERPKMKAGTFKIIVVGATGPAK